MLTDCYYCYDTPCTCGKVYDSEHFDNETLFRVKHKIEEILYERQEGLAKRIKILEEHSDKVSRYIGDKDA